MDLCNSFDSFALRCRSTALMHVGIQETLCLGKLWVGTEGGVLMTSICFESASVSVYKKYILGMIIRRKVGDCRRKIFASRIWLETEDRSREGGTEG